MEEISTANFLCDDQSQFNYLSRDSMSDSFFSFYHLNVQRISNLLKFDRLKRHIQTFQTKPDVITLVETWFLQSETGEISNAVRLYEMEGYQSIFCSRNERSIVVYVKEGINFEVSCKKNGPVSYIHLTLVDNAGFDNTAFTMFYMPRVTDYLLLFETLEDTLVTWL